MIAPPLTDTVTETGALVRGSEELAQGLTKGILDAPDKRMTMPTGGYRFGKSNPRLRPEVPEGC